MTDLIDMLSVLQSSPRHCLMMYHSTEYTYSDPLWNVSLETQNDGGDKLKIERKHSSLTVAVGLVYDAYMVMTQSGIPSLAPAMIAPPAPFTDFTTTVVEEPLASPSSTDDIPF